MLDNYRTVNQQIDGILNMISENDGQIPEYTQRDDYLADVITRETRYSTRYFYIKTDNSNNITETNMKKIASISSEEAEEIIKDILKSNQDTGYYDNFKYKITQTENGKLIVVLDCTYQLNSLSVLMKKSSIIISIGLIIVYVIVFSLSKRVLKPIIENIEKQKQFITNAGHELKTPVAVIVANADVLEVISNEESKESIKSIKKQAKRLNNLIKTLLNLANVEERNTKINYTEFSITDIVKEEISEFKALAQNKEFIYDDTKNVLMKGYVNSISQLVTIFIDNAVKYTPENGTIKIVTEKAGKSTKIQFMNTCEDVKNIDTSKLFDRFYREDKARTPKKEGYGIGLSIAKSIVEMHKGKVTAEINKDNMICFTIVI